MIEHESSDRLIASSSDIRLKVVQNEIKVESSMAEYKNIIRDLRVEISDLKRRLLKQNGTLFPSLHPLGVLII